MPAGAVEAGLGGGVAAGGGWLAVPRWRLVGRAGSAAACRLGWCGGRRRRGRRRIGRAFRRRDRLRRPARRRCGYRCTRDRWRGRCPGHRRRGRRARRRRDCRRRCRLRRACRARRRRFEQRNGGWRGKRLQLRAQVEDLAGARLDLRGRRARRRLREQLRGFEHLHKPPRVRGLAAHQQFALRLLTLGHRLQFELREPRIVGKQLADGIHDHQRAGIRILALERSVEFAYARIEFLPQCLRHAGAAPRLRHDGVQLDRIVPLLPNGNQGRGQRCGDQ